MLHGLVLLAVTALIMGGAAFIGWVFGKIIEKMEDNDEK